MSTDPPTNPAEEPATPEARVEALLAHSIDVPELASAVAQQRAADAADTLETLTGEDAADVLEQMEAEPAAAALAQMELPLAAGVIEDLVEEDPGFAGRLVGLMAPDDAADLLQALPAESAEHLFTELDPIAAARLRRLVGYDEESAGGLMTIDFVRVRDDRTIGEAVDVVRGRDVPEDMHHLPVVDRAGRLVGTIGLRDLLVVPNDERVRDHVHAEPTFVRTDEDQEHVARLFDRYDRTLLPVVDEHDRLMGVITVDDVIDIIRAEQTEDVQMTVGAGAGEAIYSGLFEKFRGRFPWLGMSLMLTAMAATTVLVFEDLIQRLPFLAFLLPLIAALVGNAGHQALAVTLRGIVLDEVRRDRVLPLVWRETLVGVLNGVVLGGLIFGGVALLARFDTEATASIGAIAGAATLLAMTVGTLAGSCVPLLMRRLGVDPAHASAIFLIMITDAVSFASLLGLTWVLLG